MTGEWSPRNQNELRKRKMLGSSEREERNDDECQTNCRCRPHCIDATIECEKSIASTFNLNAQFIHAIDKSNIKKMKRVSSKSNGTHRPFGVIIVINTCTKYSNRKMHSIELAFAFTPRFVVHSVADGTLGDGNDARLRAHSTRTHTHTQMCVCKLVSRDRWAERIHL